jgi:xanthine dehydrogenase accessory factor
VGRTLVVGDEVEGTTGSEQLDHAVVESARGMLAQGATGLRHFGPEGERRRDDVAVFIESFAPRPADAGVRRDRLRLGGRLDRPVPRLPRDRLRCPRAVRDPARFPDADEVVVDWPHRYLTSTRSTPAR